MIVVDTTVLAYAVGSEHPLSDPCRRVVAALRDGDLVATTTVEVIQEFAHVYARRRDRRSAVTRARRFIELLGPLLAPGERELEAGLTLYEQHAPIASFDAVLAATALIAGAEALLSADRAFAAVPGLRHVDPASPELEQLLR